MLSVAGDVTEEFAIGVITDTGKSCRTLSSVTQFYGENSKNLKLDKFQPAFTAATLYTVDRQMQLHDDILTSSGMLGKTSEAGHVNLNACKTAGN